MNDWQARHNISSAEFQATFDGLGLDGYRLVDVSGYTVDGRVLYTGIWERRDGPPWRARHGVPVPLFQQLFNQMYADGFRPIRLSGYATPAGPQFAGIWIADGRSDWQAHHGLDRDAFADLLARLADDHYYLIDLTAYDDPGGARYAGVWEQSAAPRPVVAFDLDAAAYQLHFDDMTSRRLVPRKVIGYTSQGSVRYAAIWTGQPSRGWHARHSIDAAEYQATFDSYRHQGFHPVQSAGYSTPAGPRFTCHWESHYHRDVLEAIDSSIQAYCTQYTVPGLSLAVSRQGRLIYARAYGFAEIWPITPLSVRHRLRIASLSKPLTATAIMVLVQRNQLKLNDRVFGANALFGFSLAPPPYDANEVAIEVEHLLNHTSGFDDVPTDPYDEQLGMNAHDLIGWTLNNRAPVAQPGTVFKYLNFGYLVLGRIIELVSGQSYETFVTDAVLKPAGITSMTIGGDGAAARQPDEVAYYASPDDQDPYTVHINRGDAASGWIATAIDLLRFVRAVDGLGSDVLTAASRARMAWGSAANPTYGLGWDVRDTPLLWTHNGALPGSIATIRMRDDGDAIVGLANSRQTGAAQSSMQNDLMTLLETIRTKLAPEPQFDLFL